MQQDEALEIVLKFINDLDMRKHRDKETKRLIRAFRLIKKEFLERLSYPDIEPEKLARVAYDPHTWDASRAYIRTPYTK